MNRSNAYAALDEVAGVYRGWFRPCWKAEPVLVCSNGEPVPFQSAKDAEIAAWRTLYEVEEPVMFRAGTMLGERRSAAETLFKRRVNA